MDFKKVTHCIFDMDGLLLDTETLYTVAYNRVTQEFGKTYTWQHKAKIMGFKSTDAVQTIIDILELPIMVQEFEDKLTTLYQELFPQCNLMPGVERLLRHLKENNIPIALATSSSQESSDLKTQRWKHIFDYFDHKCLVFEDSPNGVQAAIAAKMQVVMVPDPQLPKQLMKDATLVLKSLEDFKPESFGLPPIIA
ncbi:pseudouridine-5'-phosphatase isoform X2 [Harpegnathos saltator]|uniref:pseudouridine-5'-phosphatase isoform X2 n=1 Tax=Harpegnathos saltator TaxID=610380 RepID=UPI000948E7DE|nr:pseudouridine-5'-phosphatase isoform X2 [Harpegnathos saltator]